MNLSLRQQLLLGALLLAASGVGIRNIAQARNEAAVGGRVRVLGAARADQAAFARLLDDLARLDQPALRARLEELQRQGALWVAPGMDAGNWALYVDTFRLVRRIYIREVALLSPEAHLFPAGDAAIPAAQRQAFANVSLAGALFHELRHFDGIEEEAAAYDSEIAWLEALRAAPAVMSLDEPERRAASWGIDSAVLSARKARGLATGSRGSP